MPAGATSNMQRRVPKTTSDRVIAPQGAGCQKLASRPAEGRVFFLDIPFIEPHFFGFQPPKKFVGSLPPTRSREMNLFGRSRRPVEIGRASVGKECRSRWSPY